MLSPRRGTELSSKTTRLGQGRGTRAGALLAPLLREAVAGPPSLACGPRHNTGGSSGLVPSRGPAGQRVPVSGAGSHRKAGSGAGQTSSATPAPRATRAGSVPPALPVAVHHGTSSSLATSATPPPPRVPAWRPRCMLGDVGGAWHSGNPEGRNTALRACALILLATSRDLGDSLPIIHMRAARELPLASVAATAGQDRIMAPPASSLVELRVTSFEGALKG